MGGPNHQREGQELEQQTSGKWYKAPITINEDGSASFTAPEEFLREVGLLGREVELIPGIVSEHEFVFLNPQNTWWIDICGTGDSKVAVAIHGPTKEALGILAAFTAVSTEKALEIVADLQELVGIMLHREQPVMSIQTQYWSVERKTVKGPRTKKTAPSFDIKLWGKPFKMRVKASVLSGIEDAHVLVSNGNGCRRVVALST